MDSIQYRRGYKYQLHSDYATLLSFGPKDDIKTYFITFLADRTLKIKKGYAWDGMSGGMVDTKTSMRGSLIHDALYGLLRQNLLKMPMRSEVDDELKRICSKDGMWGWRYKLHRWGLGFGGTGAALPSSIKRIYRAP